jgi:hypothetical protein
MSNLIWTKNHEKTHSWLYNYIITIYPKAKEKNYIEIYKNKLLSIIMNCDKWKDSSKQKILFTIARWINIHSKDKTFAKPYQEAGYKFKLEYEAIEAENELDEKERLHYKEREFYIDIINSIDKDSITNKTEHYKYLLLNLLVKQPPLPRRIIYIKIDNINNDVIHHY